MSGAVAGSVLALETRRLATTHGAFDAHVYRTLSTGRSALALVRGDVTGPASVLARVHSSCVTSEVFGSCDCDCVEQLDAALAAIADAGRGVLFYLMQEGRGAGFTAKVRDRMMVQASGERLTTFEAYQRLGLARDHRTYGEVASIGALLGIEAPLTLLTGNPEKLEELELAGVVVAGTVPFRGAASPFNAHYLRTKLPLSELASGDQTPVATLPESVEYFEPFVPEGMPHLLRTASYLLPIVLPEATEAQGGAAGSEVRWFRLHAYVDLLANHERAVLHYRAPGDARVDGAPLVRVQSTPLLDRFPLLDDAVDKGRWRATVRAFVRHGSGYAVFRVAERDGIATPPEDDALAVSRMLAHHLGGRRARPVFDGGVTSPRDAVLVEGLRAQGIVLDPPLLLACRDGDDVR